METVINFIAIKENICYLKRYRKGKYFMDDIKGKIDFYETRKFNLLAIKENTINLIAKFFLIIHHI